MVKQEDWERETKVKFNLNNDDTIDGYEEFATFVNMIIGQKCICINDTTDILYSCCLLIEYQL